MSRGGTGGLQTRPYIPAEGGWVTWKCRIVGAGPCACPNPDGRTGYHEEKGNHRGLPLRRIRVFRGLGVRGLHSSRQRGGFAFAEDAEDLVVQEGVRGDDGAGEDEILGAVGGGGAAAGFTDEEAAGTDVPRLDLELPIAIEATRGGPGTIQGGGTETTHALAWRSMKCSNWARLFGGWCGCRRRSRWPEAIGPGSPGRKRGWGGR